MSKSWEEATSKMKFNLAMDYAIDLNKEQYVALHDGKNVDSLKYLPKEEFIIEKIGSADKRHFQDIGIEYYKYVG